MKTIKNMNKKIIPLVILLLTFIHSIQAGEQLKWSVILDQPNKKEVVIGTFTGSPTKDIHFVKVVDGINVEAVISRKDNLLRFEIKANSATDKTCYLSLQSNYKNGSLYSYRQEELSSKIFRQSPHDPDNYGFGELVMQDLPMFAIKNDHGFTIAINDSPCFYDNYTTQTFSPDKHTVKLSSGDNGNFFNQKPKKVKIESYYFQLGKGKSHTFNGIIVNSNAKDLNEMRRDVLSSIAKRWGNNIENNSFATTAFSSNYMLLRKNERKSSTYWVTPGIGYSNKQYTRDAFWQSMVLPANFAQECYKNEEVLASPGAERPLIVMIWAYRTKLAGGQPNLDILKKTLDYIEKHTKNGMYYSKNNNIKNYQSWCDMVGFNDDDVIAYNQGLLAVALLSAESLGLKPSVSSELAIQKYQEMFNKEKGYFPFSQQKDLLAVDPLVGDLLAQLYFKKKILSDESVLSHYKQVVSKAKTKYGYKVTCLANGDFAPREAYFAKDFTDIDFRDIGSYQWGASWYLYDMLFLIDSYLHGAPDAIDEIKWRASLDYKLGGTYFEFINTVNGTTNKPNQGWDAAIYAIWSKLIKDGKADKSMFDAIGNL